jgi:hypothetical protein
VFKMTATPKATKAMPVAGVRAIENGTNDRAERDPHN